jgi:hypothetical protein
MSASLATVYVNTFISPNITACNAQATLKAQTFSSALFSTAVINALLASVQHCIGRPCHELEATKSD